MPPNAPGPFEVGLYEVLVRGTRQGQAWFEFTIEQVGYRRALDGVAAPFGQ
jgi:hypothetical protein